MKSFLSRLSARRTIGLAIEEQQVSLSVMATSPLGSHEIQCETRPCQGDERETVLASLLAPWIDPDHDRPRKADGRPPRKRQPWVHVALPVSRVFQAIVPISGANQSAPPQVFFMEAVQATNLRPEERIIDLIKLELNKQPLACLAASPRHLVTEVVEMLTRLGTRVARVEPAPISLFRAGAAREKLPRGAKLCIRFFLGKTQAIGVLASPDQPLFWHAFDLPEDDVTGAVLATYSTLWMQGRHSKISLPIDSVIVHGRPEVELTVNPGAFQARTGARLRRCDGPDYESSGAATGLALANPLGEERGLDLARGLKPAVYLREIIPWGELALQAALVSGVSLFLQASAMELDTQLRATRVELGTFSWLKDQDQAKLEKEKAAIEERSKAIQAYSDSRMNWSGQLRTIAVHMPESTLVTSFQAVPENNASWKAAASARNQMIINFATPMAADGAMPREINEFIAALRVEPILKQRFPIIEVSGLRANAATPNQVAHASYSVVCLPAADSSTGTRGAAGARK
jgi:hypothetical protein